MMWEKIKWVLFGLIVFTLLYFAEKADVTMRDGDINEVQP